MTRKVALDGAALSLVFLLLFAIRTLAGLLALIVFVFLVVAVAGIIVLGLMVLEALAPVDDTDRHCSRIDIELDQEREARRQLRVVNTVHAEPLATVIEFPGRKTSA